MLRTGSPQGYTTFTSNIQSELEYLSGHWQSFSRKELPSVSFACSFVTGHSPSASMHRPAIWQYEEVDAFFFGAERQADFQAAWMNPQATSSAHVFQMQLGPSPDLPSMEQALRQSFVLTLASGNPNGNIKAFLFGRNVATGTTYMCELLSDVGGNTKGTCKATNAQDPDVGQFATLIQTALSGGGGSAAAPSSAADDIMSLF